MKKFLVCVAGLSCLLVIGSSSTMAQQFRRGGSGFGISFSYGNGYNNFGGYNRGYRQPLYRGGFGGGGYYGGGYGGGYRGGYPVYRSTRIYSVPLYGGGYRHRHCR